MLRFSSVTCKHEGELFKNKAKICDQSEFSKICFCVQKLVKVYKFLSRNHQFFCHRYIFYGPNFVENKGLIKFSFLPLWLSLVKKGKIPLFWVPLFEMTIETKAIEASIDFWNLDKIDENYLFTLSQDAQSHDLEKQVMQIWKCDELMTKMEQKRLSNRSLLSMTRQKRNVPVELNDE